MAYVQGAMVVPGLQISLRASERRSNERPSNLSLGQALGQTELPGLKGAREGFLRIPGLGTLVWLWLASRPGKERHSLSRSRRSQRKRRLVARLPILSHKAEGRHCNGRHGNAAVLVRKSSERVDTVPARQGREAAETKGRG